MNTASIIAPAFVHASVKRRKNTWYSVKDGNWDDPTVWMSNATKRWSYPGLSVGTPIFPAVGDDVYINHSVTLNAGSGAVPIVVNNLYVSGTFLADTFTRVINVNGDIQAVGTVNFTSSNVNMVLKGTNNYINTYTTGTTSTISYARMGDQFIMVNNHCNVIVTGIGTKYLQTNLTTSGTIIIDVAAKIELLTFNMDAGGAVSFASAIFSKNGAGSILFRGLITSGNVASTFSNTGNATIELRGGIYFNLVTLTSGTSAWTFTTNNQNLLCANVAYQFMGPWVVQGAITVTNDFHTTNVGPGILINATLNGTVAGSTFINKGNIYFVNSSATAMATFGVFDVTTYANNTVGYSYNGAGTIQYSSFQRLYINGSGVKAAPANMTIYGDLFVTQSAAIFDLGSFNLTNNGTTTLGSVAVTSSSCTLRKPGAGSILFVGNVRLSNQGVLDLDFTGNPTVEIRGGLWSEGFAINQINSGTGVWTFSTNNQTIDNRALGVANYPVTLDCPIVISGAITVTMLSSQSSAIIDAILNGLLNGNNGSSTLDNRGLIEYKNVTQGMGTGVLTTNAAANTFKYNKAGNQDVKGGTYRTIEFGGSGIKTLLGNVIVNVTGGGGQSTTGTASINLNGFTITTI